MRVAVFSRSLSSLAICLARRASSASLSISPAIGTSSLVVPSSAVADCGAASSSLSTRGDSTRARNSMADFIFARRERSSRSEEHTSELQSLMRISYAVFCLKKKNNRTPTYVTDVQHHVNTHTYKTLIQSIQRK